MSLSTRDVLFTSNDLDLPEFPLPTLPPILDVQLLNIATTHASLYNYKKEHHDLSAKHRILDYEKLEHVGDALLGACVTMLLHDLYPDLREGPATDLKADLICNTTLAQLADRYGITHLLKTSPSAFYVTRDQVKTRGSLFESWVAGVFYSYLKHGPPDPSFELPEGLRPSQAIPLTSEDELSVAFGASKADEDIPGQVVRVVTVPPREDSSSSCSDHISHDQQTESDDDEESGDETTTQEGSGSEDGTPVDDISGSEPRLLRLVEPMQPSKSNPKRQLPSPGYTLKATLTGSDTQPQETEIKTVTGPLHKSRSVKSEKPQEEHKVVSPAHVSGKETMMTDTERTNGEAFQYIFDWLKPLFTPIAQFALQRRIDEQARILAELDQAMGEDKEEEGDGGGNISSKEEDRLAQGAKLALEIYCLNHFAVKPVYTTVRPEGDKHLWLTICKVSHSDGTVWEGQGLRPSKKLGAALAAYRVGGQLDLFR